jgi:WD40 repeat protein
VGPAAGSGLDAWTRIASDHEWVDKPRWSKDGRHLYFLSRGTGAFFNLWATAFDQNRGGALGQPFPLSHIDSPSLLVSPHIEKTSMDVAGGLLALTMTTATGSIWMLDNVDK